MIIDFHTHTYPDKIAAHALAHMQELSHWSFSNDGTVSGLTASMKESGVDYSVVLPVVTNPQKTSSINNISISHQSDDHLIYFGGIHPDTEDYYEELGRIAQAGLKGIKIHPHYQGVDFDDIRYLRILDRAAELGLIVVIHAGDDPAFPGIIRSSPEMIRKVLLQLKGITMVMGHMGGMCNWDRVTDNLFDTGVYLDTANVLDHALLAEHDFDPNDDFYPISQDQFMKLVRDFGSERILFGSDIPWTGQKPTVDAVRALPLTEDEKANIFYKNACRLLSIQ